MKSANPRDWASGGTFWLVFLRLTLLVLVGFVLTSTWFRSYDHDEFEAIHTAWYLLQGQDIYVDFFQHHHPLWYALLVPVVGFLGENIYSLAGARLLAFCFGALTVVGTWLLAMELKVRKDVALCALVFLLTSTIFVGRSIEVRPDVPQVALGMLAILFYFRAVNRQGPSWMLLSGLAWALSFVFLQKAAILGLGMGLVAALDFWGGRIRFSSILTWLGGAALVLGPFFLFWFLSGKWSEYFFFNWELNALFPSTMSPIRRLDLTFRANPGQGILVVIGGLVFLKDRKNWQVPVLALVLVGSIFLVRTPYSQYLLMAAPLAVLMAAQGMIMVFKRWWVPVLLLMLGLRVVQTMPPFDVLRQENRNQEQLVKIEYVLALTRPTDTVYDGDIRFNLFRKDIDFFWFSLHPEEGALAMYQKMRGYSYSFLELIKNGRPKIVSDFQLSPLVRKRLAVNYIPTDAFPDLFIRTGSRRPSREP